MKCVRFYYLLTYLLRTFTLEIRDSKFDIRINLILKHRHNFPRDQGKTSPQVENGQ